MHNLIHHGIKPATGAATGVADNDASINTTPHDLKDDELNYKQIVAKNEMKDATDILTLGRSMDGKSNPYAKYIINFFK